MSREGRGTTAQESGARAGADDAGEVAEIYIAPKSGDEMLPQQVARAVAGRGLEGDRYFEKMGTSSSVPEPGRQVTLVEVEAIEAVRRDNAIDITPGDARRNLVTRGISLNDLVGREFRVGEATLVGIELCEPCAHLRSLLGKDVLRPLVHRGGIRADVVVSGTIRLGDRVEPM
jgi:MOSC domain-containing protein YiiM